MITLRDVREDDKEHIHTWRNQPEVAKYMYSDHYISREEHERWFAKMQTDVTCRYWIIEYEGVGIGVANIANLDEHNRRCYWGFYLANPIRGKGVGSYVEYFILRYVFEELKLNKLCGEVFAFNEAVLAMHEKFGFRKEGLLRQHIFKGGEPLDVVTIGILHDEWYAIKSQVEERLRGKGLL